MDGDLENRCRALLAEPAYIQSSTTTVIYFFFFLFLSTTLDTLDEDDEPILTMTLQLAGVLLEFCVILQKDSAAPAPALGLSGV